MSERLLPGPPERTARIWQPADLLRSRGSTGGFTPTQWRSASPQFVTLAPPELNAPEEEDHCVAQILDEDPPPEPQQAPEALALAAPAAEPVAIISPQELEQARLQAYAEGQELGRHEAQQALRETRAAEDQALRERLRTLEQSLGELRMDPQRLHEPLKRLALHLAEQLVLGELSQSPQAIERLVRRCVDELASRRSQVLVELHPDDLVLLQPVLSQHKADEATDSAPPWQLQANDSLRPGSVRASADDAVVSDLIEHRLDALARQLLLDPQRQARQSAFQPECLAARRAEVDSVLDAHPRMADVPRSNRFSPVVDAAAAPATTRVPEPAPPPEPAPQAQFAPPHEEPEPGLEAAP